ncbi:MAG: bifunctional hydroxymethylpyrimidine kinase/phosphomethylpyrimidine kinase [Acetobacteraceae bacterium]|nr:bifunctional hydroxymethylpyrimidine kinase/phosphomethylpyrimidine kinase [Acetobacteraceae bacterium]
MADVVVLGSYNLDLVATVPRFPAPGETLRATGLLRGHGGKGSNQAVAARRAGAATAFVGVLGADDAGAAARAMWQSEMIEALVSEHRDLPTGTALILVAPSGENQIVVVAGANEAVTAAEAARAAGAVRQGAVALAQLETPPAASLGFFTAARARGSSTLLNTAPAVAALPPALLAATDILVANEGEAGFLCAMPPATPPTRLGPLLAARAAKAAVITCGADGAWLFARDAAPVHQPAATVSVVDTTGAGDCFVGAFAAALARGAAPEEALADGVAAGSAACTRAGAIGSVPDRAAIAAMRTGLPPARSG